MKTLNNLNGVALAMAAAGLFALGSPAFAQEAGEQAEVKCYGANDCKGQSDCATATSDCEGKNACEGKGFKTTTQEECDELGGTTEEPEG